MKVTMTIGSQVAEVITFSVSDLLAGFFALFLVLVTVAEAVLIGRPRPPLAAWGVICDAAFNIPMAFWIWRRSLR